MDESYVRERTNELEDRIRQLASRLSELERLLLIGRKVQVGLWPGWRASKERKARAGEIGVVVAIESGEYPEVTLHFEDGVELEFARDDLSLVFEDHHG